MAENDGIDDELRAALQVGLTTAARLGEQAARAREQRTRNAQARSAQEAREDAGRLSAERDAARASLAPVHRDDWWDAAQAQDVTQAYQTARAWAEVDPEARRAQERIAKELRGRYGLDQVPDSGSVRDALDKADRERAKGKGDGLEATALMLAADEADRRAEDAAERAALTAAAGAPEEATHADVEHAQESANATSDERAGEVAYDSADRREEMAQRLEGTVDNKAAVLARVRADTSQAKPATEATRRAAAKAPKARRSRTSVPGRQSQRGGQTR